jgi:2-oxoglutarate ferredoxin oxidoreductase subunit alpha
MGMRPGPATGMPTWTSQGDLRFMLHAAQDEFPRIILTPGDHLETVYLTMKAFNLAEKYQLPVIVLVDKYLMEGHKTVLISEMKNVIDSFTLARGKMRTDEDLANEPDYKRYLLTDDGISPRSIPGQKGGIALTGSDEHDEHGLYDEGADNRIKMMDKRFKKLDIALEDMDPPQFFGWKDAGLTILSWGSNKLPIFEAMKWLKKDGISINYLHITHMYPFPHEEVKAVIHSAKNTLVIESNKSGQFEGMIREYTGLSVDHHLRKFDGRPFYPEEIVEHVKGLIVK